MPTSTGTVEVPHHAEEALERPRVVDGLGHDVLGARLDLLLQPPDLLLHVRLARVGPAADVDAQGGPDQVPREVAAVVQVVHDPDEPDRVHVVDRGGVRVVAELGRVAGDGQDVAEPERVGAEQVRLDPQQVPVAAGVVEDRLDPDLRLEQHAERLRAHARGGARTVRDVDRVDLVLLAVLRALQDDGRDRRPSGGSSSTETTNFLPSFRASAVFSSRGTGRRAPP